MVTALVLAAGAAGWFIARGSEHAVSLGQPPQQASTTQAAQQTGALPSARSFEVWFSKDGHLVEALRTHSATRRVATAALDALLAGPTPSERAAGLRSDIPTGTRLLGIAIAGGVARVDLTSDFESAAASRSLQLRLAQIVYTLTQFPTVKKVRFAVDGTPVAALAAGGRSDYRSLAPVVSPLAGRWRLLSGSPVGPLTNRVAAWTGREVLIMGLTGTGQAVLLGYQPSTNTWRRLAAPSPLTRGFHAAWTGRELIVWGTSFIAYSPSSGRWRHLSRPPFVQAETMAWTGRELLAWGDSEGAAYRPATDRWRRLPPEPASGGPAVWTGREALVVTPEHVLAFKPGSGWRRLARPPAFRALDREIWDGKELLVVEGEQAPRSGYAYDPRENSWRTLARMDSGRRQAAAVWNGKRLLIWGGETGPLHSGFIPPHGLAYDPTTDRWSPLPQAPLRGRRDPVGVWTGRSLIVWGGDPGFADGAAFTPAG